jgi:hypothetical protein
MSASHRRIARLPLDVFDNLTTDSPNEPETLRTAICSKLKKFPIKTRTGGASFDSVKTVGALLQTSKTTLLCALDPLLTYGWCQLLLFLLPNLFSRS